jgi:aerobic carbon-monoxide dehydrogenase large subunit
VFVASLRREGIFEDQESKGASMSSAASDRQAEKEFHRIEDIPFLQGKAQFVDDIKISNLLHVAFVRSSHAHAMIRSISTDDARKVVGVRAVLTYNDLRPLLKRDRISLALPSAYLKFDIDPYVLVKDEATYVGEPIAMVVAESRHIAEDAAGMVSVDYDPLPAVVDPVAALEKGSPKTRLDCPGNLVAQTSVRYGDAAAAFATAAHVFSEQFRLHKGGGHSIEGRGIVANFDRASDQLTVWNSTQMPHRCKAVLLDMLGLSEHQVRVIAPNVGGGFGPKAVFHPEELAIPAAALLLEASLKWIEDRFEHFVATVQERDQVWNVDLAADRDGRLLGIRGQLRHDHGACTPYGLAVPYNSVTNLVGTYVLPAMDFDIYWCLTNKVPASSTRGAGRPQGTFVIERMLDVVANRLGLDRTEVRRRNLIPHEKMPYSVPIRMRDGNPMTYDSGNYPECQRQALLAADWDGFAARREASLKLGLRRGIGLSNYVELTGRGPFESVTVRIGPSGKIMVATGATSQGQGTKTALAQIVSDALHVDVDRIHVTCGDTAASFLGVGAFASRQTVTAGNSAFEAAKIVGKKALDIASVLMEVGVDDLELHDGAVRVKGVPGMKRDLGELAKAVNGSIGFPLPGGIDAGLFAMSNFQVQGTPFSNGTHVAEVEIDPETAATKIVRYTVVHDCGRVINAKIVDGQVLGGVVHGIGAALFEWMQYDDSGQPLTVTLADYLLPTADVLARITIGHMESPSPLNPLGVKGAGEGGTIGAPAAIASAVEDALRPFRVPVRDLPITPARLYEKIRAAQEDGVRV